MREFANYVFDFYGTLVDVHTDENKPETWRFMADLYGAWGCVCGGEELRRAFWRIDAEERAAARRRTGLENAEIRIERVFLRLLMEAESRPCGMPIGGRGVGEWRKRYARGPERVLGALESGDWVAAVANGFRIHTRDWLRPYPDTRPVLEELVRRGKRIYLLTNAQGVFTRPEIAATGLDAFFPAPRISSEAGVMKPQGEFLGALLREEGLEAGETAFVGNEMRSDMALALRCGVQGIYLNTAGAALETVQSEAERTAREVGRGGAGGVWVAGRLGELVEGWGAF